MDSKPEMQTENYEVDARGLNCPLPILRAKKKLGLMVSGETVWVFSTDPGSVEDFTAFAESTGHTLLDLQDHGEEFHFLLRKA